MMLSSIQSNFSSKEFMISMLLPVCLPMTAPTTGRDSLKLKVWIFKIKVASKTLLVRAFLGSDSGPVL